MKRLAKKNCTIAALFLFAAICLIIIEGPIGRPVIKRLLTEKEEVSKQDKTVTTEASLLPP
jgi:hypothetical protein